MLVLLSMDELVIAVGTVLASFLCLCVFCTVRRALVYTRGSRLTSISLLLLLLLFSLLLLFMLVVRV